MKRFLTIGAVFALALGFASCNKDKGNGIDTPDNTDTYVGVRIAFPGAAGTRASLPNDYNINGEWKGRDQIKQITVYLVYSDRVDFATFNEKSFDGIDTDGFLAPNLAVKATSGQKVKAYAVINDVNGKTDALKTVSATEFDAKFKELEVSVTSVADVATFDSDKKEDIVMMTNDTAAGIPEITIASNVSEDEAKAGGTNRADITVSRVVSRAMVTIKEGANMEIPVKNTNKETISTITVTDVTYAVGQSNLKFFNMRGKGDMTSWITPDPVYAYVPTTDDWSGNNKNFDYSDLKNPKALVSILDKTNENVVKALEAEQFSKFVLPVTHKDEVGQYKKGNMTYFEIICKFSVDKVYGEADEFTENVKDTDVYLGMSDGKFYTTRELAQAKGQQATKFTGGVMKYVIWLNPDGSYADGGAKITQSPTVRNQVYHAHITGFKEIGVPNNPLNPEDPNDPDNPDNPINPGDDPETEKTYLSVSLKVLPWTIHSYSVDLGNRY